MSALGVLAFVAVAWGLIDLVIAGAWFLRAAWTLLTEVVPNLVLWALRR